MSDRLERLRALHAAPKNVIRDNLRMVTQPQLDFYYAAHDALPALLDVVEAVNEEHRWATGTAEHDKARDDLYAKVARFESEGAA